MLKEKSYFCLGLIILLLSACSPKITKNVIIKDLPQQDTTLPITIYADVNDIPDKTISIGTLFIGDGGFTTKCDSASVFILAGIETRKAGGNALHLTNYTKPSIFGSSCHQITGTMLYVPVSSASKDTSAGLIGSAGNTYPSNNTSNADNTKNIDEVAKRTKERKLDIASFRADLGYAWRTAKIGEMQSSFEDKLYNSLHSGLSFSLSGEYFFSDIWGARLLYNQYHSTFNEIATNDYGQRGDFKASTDMKFIGPAVVIRSAFGTNNDWYFSGYIGLGYSDYKIQINHNASNTDYSETGLTGGFVYGIDIDHKINDNWGVGISASLFGGIVTTVEIDNNGYKQTYTTTDINSGVGLGQFSIKVGARYFINPTKKKQ